MNKTQRHHDRDYPRRNVLAGFAVAAGVLAATGLKQTAAHADPAATAGGVQQLRLLDGAIIGRYRLADRPRAGAPLIVYLHGGGSSSAEADIPGHSQLELSAAHGYSAFAPDRPGYGGSASLNVPDDSDDGLFEANAARLDDAVAEIWRTWGSDCSGVVIHGSSIGGAVALTLVARWAAGNRRGENRWPLLGLGICDIGQQPRPYATDLWHALPDGQTLSLGDSSLVRPELLEITGAWPRGNWARVSSEVPVPVYYRLARNDQLWVENHTLTKQFADALRTRSPRVDAAVMDDGAFHPIPKSPAADPYNAQFMDFVAGLTA